MDMALKKTVSLNLFCALFCCLHMIIRRCRPGFGSAWSSAERSSLAQSGSALHTQI